MAHVPAEHESRGTVALKPEVSEVAINQLTGAAKKYSKALALMLKEFGVKRKNAPGIETGGPTRHDHAKGRVILLPFSMSHKGVSRSSEFGSKEKEYLLHVLESHFEAFMRFAAAVAHKHNNVEQPRG